MLYINKTYNQSTMDQKQQFTKVWNTTLTQFLTTLQSTFPNEKIFKQAMAAIPAILMVDKTKIVRNFYKYSSRYESYVENKNEEFFLSCDFSQEQQHSDDGSHLLAIIGSLRGLWISMTPQNKEAMWNWISKLYKLAKIICSTA